MASVGVPTFTARDSISFWGSLMGACPVVNIPIAILYKFFVDRFVTGYTATAI